MYISRCLEAVSTSLTLESQVHPFIRARSTIQTSQTIHKAKKSRTRTSNNSLAQVLATSNKVTLPEAHNLIPWSWIEERMIKLKTTWVHRINQVIPTPLGTAKSVTVRRQVQKTSKSHRSTSSRWVSLLVDCNTISSQAVSSVILAANLSNMVVSVVRFRIRKWWSQLMVERHTSYLELLTPDQVQGTQTIRHQWTLNSNPDQFVHLNHLSIVVTAAFTLITNCRSEELLESPQACKCPKSQLWLDHCSRSKK